MSNPAVPAASATPPLDWPWYGIGFGAAIRRGFQKYVVFRGRASRGEYWWWFLFVAAVSFVLVILSNLTSRNSPGFFTYLYGLWLLAVFIPGLAVAVRRLHDTGRSGWWYFLSLIPIVGGIILIVFMASPTTPDAAKYGPPEQPALGYGPGPGTGYPASGYPTTGYGSAAGYDTTGYGAPATGYGAPTTGYGTGHPEGQPQAGYSVTDPQTAYQAPESQTGYQAPETQTGYQAPESPTAYGPGEPQAGYPTSAAEAGNATGEPGTGNEPGEPGAGSRY